MVYNNMKSSPYLRHAVPVRIFVFIWVLLIGLHSSLFAEKPVVYVLRIDGAINPAAADYIHSAIEKASKSGVEAILIQLNTPGGLLKSTGSSSRIFSPLRFLSSCMLRQAVPRLLLQVFL